MIEEKIVKYKIPLRYKAGKYLLKDIIIPESTADSECMIFEHNETVDIISNNMNDIRTYQLKINVYENTEVKYRRFGEYMQDESDNNLDSVYLTTKDGEKLPLFFDYGTNVYYSRRKELFAKIQECIELYTSEILEKLKSAHMPLQPLEIMYYNDCENTSIDVVDVINGIEYGISNDSTFYLIMTLVNSVPDYANLSVLDSILMGIYNRLCYEIPQKFELSDIYELNLPAECD